MNETITITQAVMGAVGIGGGWWLLSKIFPQRFRATDNRLKEWEQKQRKQYKRKKRLW